MFKWLDKQPFANNLEELQEQVDRFDAIYNTERPHQGLPGRMTPQQAWDATVVAEAPRPDTDALARTGLPVIDEIIEANPAAEIVTAYARQMDQQMKAEGAIETLTVPVVEAGSGEKIRGSVKDPGERGQRKLKTYSNGTLKLGETMFFVTKRMGSRVLNVDWDPENILISTIEGELIADFPRPAAGTKYVGIDRATVSFQNADKR